MENSCNLNESIYDINGYKNKISFYGKAHQWGRTIWKYDKASHRKRSVSMTELDHVFVPNKTEKIKSRPRRINRRLTNAKQWNLSKVIDHRHAKGPKMKKGRHEWIIRHRRGQLTRLINPIIFAHNKLRWITGSRMTEKNTHKHSCVVHFQPGEKKSAKKSSHSAIANSSVVQTTTKIVHFIIHSLRLNAQLLNGKNLEQSILAGLIRASVREMYRSLFAVPFSKFAKYEGKLATLDHLSWCPLLTIVDKNSTNILRRP